MSRVLLVCPAFHGYGAALAAALSDRGHVVTTHVYDAVPGPWGKAGLKLRHELPQRLGREPGWLSGQVTGAAIEALRAVKPNVVVVVRGDLLARDFWEAVTTARAARVLWLYDELRRTGFTESDLPAVGPIATYSPLDARALSAAGLQATHLPLAFDSRLDPRRDPSRQPSGEVAFIGARYPIREALLVSLADAGVPVRAYGRDWSHHPWDRLRTWDLRRPAIASERDLPRSAAYQVMAQACATLNLHTNQDGFTMRTFEAAGVGGLQLIDRSDVAGLYEPGDEVATFESLEELVALCGRAQRDRAWSTRLRAAARARTLAEHTFDHRAAALEALWA